jgi:peptidoglycan/xylan/chitin deacetylase (PgdA/CDA1 family)
MPSAALAKRSVLAEALYRSSADWLIGSACRWSGLLVLNYHRIGIPNAECDPDLYSASQEEFDRQIAHLKRHFEVIGGDDIASTLSERGRRILVTFDDGYRDNYLAAFPILKRHGVPATFFLATGYLDRPTVPWWDEIHILLARSSGGLIPDLDGGDYEFRPEVDDRLAVARRVVRRYKLIPTTATGEYLDNLARGLGVSRVTPNEATDLWMTWDIVREMKAAGMNFGGHSASHPVLAMCTAERQKWEIEQCRNRIASELGQAPTLFSYPVGGPNRFTSETTDLVRAAGFQFAFTFSRGWVNNHLSNPLRLSRAAVESEIGFGLFSAMTYLPNIFC